VLARGIDAMWAVDLIDMQHHAKDNDHVKNIIAVIDVFCKFGWMKALKQKTREEVASALKNEEKSCVVERWNRTMKDRVFKYFTARNTLHYIDVLNNLVT
jgi:hypothetical protein